MRKKIIISIFIIITILQAIIPIKTNAFVENREITSTPAKIERYKTEDEVNEATGIDTATGRMLEPTVEFVTVILDSLMAILTSVMTPNEFEQVMIKYDELPENNAETSATFTITESEMENYQRFGGLAELKYPNFQYSPEEIFSGNIDFLNVDFITGKNAEGELITGDWASIRYVISEWYKVLRMIAIIGLLSVLIYTGIKIIISSNAKDKAKYKEMIMNWFIAVILAFSMHYIMAFIINVIKEITGLLGGITGAIQVDAGGTIFKTNLIGLARFQMQQLNYTDKVGHLVIYTALVIYTFKFTFLYLKRVLKMAFLTVISPIVALTYPIDKMEGKAQGFNMWLNEYMYNALLQLLHYLLYYILVSTSLSLAAANPLYGIVALMFISQAEKLLKKMFRFDKARAGTVGSIAGAYATGAITSKLNKIVKNPLHPFGGGSGKGKGSSGGSKGQLGSGGTYNNDEVPTDGLIDDINVYDFLNSDIRTNSQSGSQEEEEIDLEGNMQIRANLPESSQAPLVQTEDSITPGIFATLGIDDSISRYRTDLSQYSDEELGGLSFDEGDPIGNIDDMISVLSEYQRRLKKSGKTPAYSEHLNAKLEQLRDSSVIANEINFVNQGIPLQYVDGDSRSTTELIDEIIRLNKLANNTSLAASQRRRHAREAQRLMQLVKRRMVENQYIQKQGGPQALMQHNNENSVVITNDTSLPQTERPMPGAVIPNNPEVLENPVDSVNSRNSGTTQPIVQTQPTQRLEEQQPKEEKTKRTTPRVIKGVGNVAKTMAKPVWDGDVRNPWKYNGKRLVGRAVRGVAGITFGVGAAAVQAGISITDGKYKPMEGVATIGAGMTGVSKIAQRMSRGTGNIRQTYIQGAQQNKTMEEYSKQWFNRDDIISNYNREFPGQGKEMRRRAVDNYVSRGITDFQEQKKAIKYAELLRKERGMDIDEADRLSAATLQYKQTLARSNNYNILYDKDKRIEYLKIKADAYTGAASRDSVRRLHDDFIENVRDFDRANR